MADRLSELLASADDFAVTLAEGASLLRISGHDVSRRELADLARHLRLVPLGDRPTGGRPAAVFRLGVLRDAAVEFATDRDTRKAVLDMRRAKSRDMLSA